MISTAERKPHETGRFSLRRFFEWQACRLLKLLGVCACPRTLVHQDGVTGDEIRLARLERFLIFSVNARDYVFDPLSGRLVGTGMGCGATQPSCCKPEHRPRLVLTKK